MVENAVYRYKAIMGPEMRTRTLARQRRVPMLTPETIEKMNAMKLFGLVSAFETQLSSSEYKELSFEERVGLLVDAEWTAREQRKLSRRLRAAKLRYPACLENVNFQAPRGLNREQILSLGNCRFVGERHNLLITGPTGIGKSFLACAFVERACRRGFTGCYELNTELGVRYSTR